MKNTSSPPKLGLPSKTDPKRQEQLNWKRIEGIARFLKAGAKNNPEDLSLPIINQTEMAWFADLLLRAGAAENSRSQLLGALGLKRRGGRPGAPEITAMIVGQMILLHEERGLEPNEAIVHVRDYIEASRDGMYIHDQTLKNWRNKAAKARTK